MPLIENKVKISGGHMLIWRMEESIEQLLIMLPKGLDLNEYETISHPGKKREWLAARLLFVRLCKEAGIHFQGIWKNQEGKPFLIGSSAHISLTHSEDLVVAAFQYDAPLGIDLERPRSQLIRTASKYLSPPELEAAGYDMDLLCRYWSAKEAVYKLFGGKKISLRQNIRVYTADLDAPWTALVSTSEITGKADVQFEVLSGYYLAIAVRS